MFFGLNLGRTWHTSDVENVTDRFPLGVGFIFGTSINQNYGNALSFDLRLRYLGGNWYGQDSDTTGAIGANTALSEYDQDLGYSVQNFKSTQHRLSLELAIHANRFRERTGWDPYIFGGIGFTATQTKGDLLNNEGFIYDYEANTSGSQINQDYQSPLNKSEGELYDDTEFESNVLPSLGIGLGYYFNSRFSIGLEHKSTFFSNDYFDGTTLNQNGQPSDLTKNDIYHYTSVYFRWYLKRRGNNNTTTTLPNDDTETNNYTDSDVSRKQPPLVNFTNPSSSPQTVSSPTFTLRADIKHVDRSQDVTFRQEGSVNHNYTFNPMTEKFQSNVQLKPGQNVFKLRGVNNHGSDEATMIINYERRDVNVPKPPKVTIVDPTSNPATVNQPSYKLKATIENISQNNQLEVEFNGQTVSNYNFTPNGSSNFDIQLSLKNGVNTFKVKGTNNDGSDSDETTIIYQRTESIHPPIVDFTNPSNHSTTVTNKNFNLKGTVRYVESKSKVTFVQNGNNNNNFSFNAGTNQFSSNVILKPGQNIFQLEGTNQAGSDQETVVINYEVEQPKPPVVSILNPSSNPHTTYNDTKSFKASVLNVTSKNQVSMTLNGTNYNAFDFTTSNGILTAVLPLQLGTNVVTVKGTNSDGTDSKQTTIIYHKLESPQPPIVEYVVPSSTPHQTNSDSQLVRATVQNVSNANQINVNLNGNNVTNFSFNSTNHVVEFTASLVEGVNTVMLTGTNNDGTDSETMTIIYQKLEKPTPPVVTYIDPLTNPKTVYNSTYNVEAKVKHVDGKSDITLRINGNSTNNFNYSTSSEIMNFNASLVNGANIIEITGTNEYGQDLETTSIIYQKSDPVSPPNVNITNPLSNNHVSTQSTIQIGATVLNVSSQQDIAVTVNGSSISNFSYNNTSKQVQFTMNLVEGNNHVEVTGTNSAGSDSDDKTIVYDPEEEIEPPYVSFINPPSSGYVVNNPTFEMVAQVENVQSKSDIEVHFNGSEINSNLYSFYPNSKEVHFTTNLTNGNNVFKVKGTNQAGSHQSSSNVIYEQPDENCDEPEVTFNAPSSSGTVTNDDYFNVSAVINHVTNPSDIELLVNGIEVGSFNFNTATHILLRKVDLIEGNNVVEIIAENDCDKTDKTIIIKYEIPDAPCETPEVTSINPSGSSHTTLNQAYNFSASASNIDNTQQLQLKINGMPSNFNFDLGTHQISSNINLNEGNNTVEVIATNDCGVDKRTWTIKRDVCHDPEISLNTSPKIPSNGKMINSSVQFSGSISDVASNNISVQHNGDDVNFVYDEVNESFNLSLNFVEGSNVIKITATNNCGSDSKTYTINYEPIKIKTPPTVEIITPNSDPFTTSNASENIVANTTNISSNNQISVTVNNTNVNFSFDASNEEISFNQSLSVGNNQVEIEVVNSDGSATDATMIIYEKPVLVSPPVVTFSSPDSSPKTVQEGNFTVTGEVTNLTSENQLQLIVNNQAFSGHTSTLQNGNLQFTFDIPVNATHSNYDIKAIGTNSAGSDDASVEIKLEEEEEDENCMPQVGASFTNDHHSVTATSTKDLSNVVLKFSDGTTQKFENLSGSSITLSGTGANSGKCITGVWVKSGCNQSGDGPGYGEWVENTDYDNECEIVPCDPPVLSLESNTDVNNAPYTLQLSADHVSNNQVSITHNGNSVNCNYSSSNQLFTCQVTLVEGTNTFNVVAQGCDTVTETYTVNYTIPCDPITFNRTFPAQQNETVTDDQINITLTAQHQSSVSVSVNGNNYTNVSTGGNQITINNVSLNEGANSIVVTLVNDCSQENINYTITYEAPSSCGPRINPGNAAWQFCLVTPSGTYTRDDLASNSNFTYTGPASSIYFKAIAGGGDATVNGNNYNIQTGKYYLFEGNITVSVSTSHPGSMGHWQVCIDASAAPQFGNGGNRPASPCESKSKAPTKPSKPVEKPSRDTKKPAVEPEEEKEETKPTNIKTKPTRTRPSRNENKEETPTEKEAPEKETPERNTPEKTPPERNKPVRTPPSRSGGR
ncbi:MAG: hypothetical protein WEA99_00930 [Brumimicrobium sp.]